MVQTNLIVGTDWLRFGRLGMIVPGAAPTEESEMELPDETKARNPMILGLIPWLIFFQIFFCSRTHSQLSQFVNELRRVHLPSSTGDSVEEQVKHLSLGSRKNLCINTAVTKLNNATAINEKCLELQKSGVYQYSTRDWRLANSADTHIGTTETKKCKFLPARNDQVIVRDFRDYALADIRDIEDLANLGKKLGTCPYYAARSAIKPSEVCHHAQLLHRIMLT